MESSSDNTDVVTMIDLLNDEKELSDQAYAVFAGSDEKNCNGFKQRQALYSCLTCASDVKEDSSKAIGICLACSLNCHDKHELVELYTKRNFHCDCGMKDGSVTCHLDPTKTKNGAHGNSNNKYNQNFSGIYCKCKRPYPDPESSSSDEMIQCVICEDWFHSLHLELAGQIPPAAESYSEMICEECMKQNDFLYDYSEFTVTATNDPSSDADTNASKEQAATKPSTSSNTEKKEDDESFDKSVVTKRMKLSDDICHRPKNKENTKSSLTHGSAAFWKGPWREKLCKCEKCLKIYESLNISFLTDMRDTTHFYEEKAKEKEQPASAMSSMEAALSSLPRVQQIDAISSYNNMKEKLFEFLQTFVVNNQIVQEEDIHRFFRNMTESKDNQLPGTPQHFCR
ncbi:CLUMA_CG000106, isoform A [Clunio marinus]|uniref:CLUMA_CG000106, isoform A n=1 Tax=Clunio marinus TaxID=568069 RepID=A0A1J1HJ28_9DIPT|nr:CLUMA_CG000106, isoform A [Clunio marinus]